MNHVILTLGLEPFTVAKTIASCTQTEICPHGKKLCVYMDLAPDGDTLVSNFVVYSNAFNIDIAIPEIQTSKLSEALDKYNNL